MSRKKRATKQKEDVIPQGQDDNLSIVESVQDEESFAVNEIGFFDGLLGPEDRFQASINSQQQIKEKVLKQTLLETKATSLNEKILTKKLKVERKLKRLEKSQGQDNQQGELEPDGEVLVKNERYNDVFAFDTEFQQLGIGKGLIRALNDISFLHPTKVQKLALPPVLSGKDVLVSSMTGSGKTAAFLLPALQRFGGTSVQANYSKVLIVLPTRELALQCYEMFEQLNKYVRCTASLIIGAVPIAQQEVELRKHPDFIIATPGRLVDLLKNSFSIDLQNIEILVFDEADRLLEMGFEKEVSEILKETPLDRQTILFSATLTAGINRLTELALKKPIRISVDYDQGTASGLKQYLVRIRSNLQEDREAHLIALLTKQFVNKTIVFVKTKKECHRIAMILGLLSIKCCELHGNLSQQQRIKAFEDFKEGKFQILLATDLAARGLDIANVKAVINFEIPYEITRYIHRVGRTARIGSEGVSVTLCLEKEVRDFKKMIRQSKIDLNRLHVNLTRVSEFKSKIEQLEAEIYNIQGEEYLEREIRKADMETKKAENLLNHDEDIHRRPKKMWIESFRQKLQRQNVQFTPKRRSTSNNHQTDNRKKMFNNK